MYTYGLDEKTVKLTFKWTLRVGMTLAILLAVYGAIMFFKATWLIMHPETIWPDARVQNLLVASGFHFGAGLYLWKNMVALIEMLHAPKPVKQQVVLKLNSDE